MLDHHTVLEGELVGAILALNIIQDVPRTGRVATILLDGQVAIRSLQQRSLHQGQYLVTEFHSQLNSLVNRRLHLSVHICWVPGHTGNKGNELADEHAKAAATGDCTPPPCRIRLLACPLPASSAALRALALRDMKGEWVHRWTTSPRGRHFVTTIHKPPHPPATPPPPLPP